MLLKHSISNPDEQDLATSSGTSHHLLKFIAIERRFAIMIPEEEQANYETFRDCLSDTLIQNLTLSKPKINVKKVRSGKPRQSRVDSKPRGIADKGGLVESAPSSDAEELGEFIEVCTPFYFSTVLRCRLVAHVPSISACAINSLRRH
jgi:hypothetical protein